MNVNNISAAVLTLRVSRALSFRSLCSFPLCLFNLRVIIHEAVLNYTKKTHRMAGFFFFFSLENRRSVKIPRSDIPTSMSQFHRLLLGGVGKLQKMSEMCNTEGAANLSGDHSSPRGERGRTGGEGRGEERTGGDGRGEGRTGGEGRGKGRARGKWESERLGVWRSRRERSKRNCVSLRRYPSGLPFLDAPPLPPWRPPPPRVDKPPGRLIILSKFLGSLKRVILL